MAASLVAVPVVATSVSVVAVQILFTNLRTFRKDGMAVSAIFV